MQLPAFFGQRKSVNLLPRDEFESSSLGVILSWALAFGKWSVIVTQLIVMATFLWRFGLDRQLTNLRRQIDQQAAVINSYSQLETDFLLAQKRVAFAKPVLATHQTTVDVIQFIKQATPSDVWYERISVTTTNVSLTAYAGSLNSFSQLLLALQSNPLFTAVSIGSIEDGGVKGAQLRFDITLTMGAKK